ncbi:unnamed protein product [Laminaria digitata]
MLSKSSVLYRFLCTSWVLFTIVPSNSLSRGIIIYITWFIPWDKHCWVESMGYIPWDKHCPNAFHVQSNPAASVHKLPIYPNSSSFPHPNPLCLRLLNASF